MKRAIAGLLFLLSCRDSSSEPAVAASASAPIGDALGWRAWPAPKTPTPVTTLVSDTFRERDGTAATIAIRGDDSYDFSHGTVIRSGYVSRRDRWKLFDLMDALGAERGIDAGSARGEISYSSRSSDSETQSVRYDVDAPPRAARAVHDLLLRVSAVRARGDELDVLDCYQLTTLDDGLLIDETVQDHSGKMPDGRNARSSPSPESWAQFWRSVDVIGAWSWAPRYMTARWHTHGCAFGAHLAHDGRTLDTWSHLATPPEWERLRAAIALLRAPK